jgi:hypothetical protein
VAKSQHLDATERWPMTINVLTLSLAIVVAATLLGGIFQGVPVVTTGNYSVAIVNRLTGGVHFCSLSACNSEH